MRRHDQRCRSRCNENIYTPSYWIIIHLCHPTRAPRWRKKRSWLIAALLSSTLENSTASRKRWFVSTADAIDAGGWHSRSVHRFFLTVTVSSSQTTCINFSCYVLIWNQTWLEWCWLVDSCSTVSLGLDSRTLQDRIPLHKGKICDHLWPYVETRNWIPELTLSRWDWGIILR